jgi:UrcA family protein
MIAVNRVNALIAASLFGLISSSLTALPALADGYELPKATVKFADLNIARAQGAEVLYRRISAAARTVCTPADTRDLAAKTHSDACIARAIADAVTAVGSPMLSDVYSAKTGKSTPVRVASLLNR